MKTEHRFLFEDHVQRFEYLDVKFDDGTFVTFLPRTVSCRIDENGQPVWLSVGLSYDWEAMEDDYCVVFFDHVVDVRIAAVQPLPDAE